MADDGLKSSYELALERFKKKDAEAGVAHKPLTDEQKAAIADLRSLYQSKIAELEILHQRSTIGMVDPAAGEAADAEYHRDRERLNADREKKIEAVRRGE